MHEFDAIIIEDESGGYVAFVPALPGCHMQRDNLKEAVELAWKLCLKRRRVTYCGRKTGLKQEDFFMLLKET